jgi:hypothetical protein
MAFDQNDTHPVVQPAKRTTQVNIWMIAGVIAFFVLGGLAIAWYHRHPQEVTNQVNHQMQNEDRKQNGQQ